MHFSTRSQIQAVNRYVFLQTGNRFDYFVITYHLLKISLKVIFNFDILK